MKEISGKGEPNPKPLHNIGNFEHHIDDLQERGGFWSGIKKPESHGIPGAKTPDVSAPTPGESDPAANLHAEQRAREQLSKPPPEEPGKVLDTPVQEIRRDQADHRETTTSEDPDAPDAWRYSYKIFGDRVSGGLKDLNAHISFMEKEKGKPDDFRRSLMDVFELGGEELDTNSERRNERLDAQFAGYVKGLQDARKML